MQNGKKSKSEVTVISPAGRNPCPVHSEGSLRISQSLALLRNDKEKLEMTCRRSKAANQEPGTRNPEPGTRNPEPGTPGTPILCPPQIDKRQSYKDGDESEDSQVGIGHFGHLQQVGFDSGRKGEVGEAFNNENQS